MEEEDGQVVDDEWFYQSIKRYDHLCMYSLSNNVEAMAMSFCGGFLLLAGHTRSNSDAANGAKKEEKSKIPPKAAGTEIMVLALPNKLLSKSSEQEGLAVRRDFTLVAGYHTDATSTEYDYGSVKQVRIPTISLK